MASEKTENLGLTIYPDITEVYQRDLRQSYLENFRLLDAALKKLSETLGGLAKVASSGSYKDLTDTPDAVEIATQQKAGIVKPDGDTILVMEDGTIKAAVKVALATVDAPGIVAPDGDTILIDEKGKIRAAVKVNIATTDAAGIVKPDGTTIEVDKDGKIKANIPDCYTKAQVDQMLSDISSLLMTDADLELLYSATDALMGENNTYSGLGTNIVAVSALADELLK